MTSRAYSLYDMFILKHTYMLFPVRMELCDVENLSPSVVQSKLMYMSVYFCFRVQLCNIKLHCHVLYMAVQNMTEYFICW